MKLCIINGSPRGKSSNSKILSDRFAAGFCSVESHCEVVEVFLKKEKEKAVELIRSSDIAIVVFPLYTDAMPGIVKQWIEMLGAQQFSNLKLKLGFIVQSGFPEGHHSVFVKKYLDKLAKRLQVDYLGTVIKGGVEGVKDQPKWMIKRYLQLFYDLGQHLSLTWEFDPQIIRKLRKPEHLGRASLLFYRMLIKTGMAGYYWNKQLKDNHAYGNRLAKPYYETSTELP